MKEEKCACEIHLRVDPELEKEGIKPLKCYCIAKECPHKKFTYYAPGEEIKV